MPSNQYRELILRITAIRKPKQALEEASCEASPDLVKLPGVISSFASLCKATVTHAKRSYHGTKAEPGDSKAVNEIINRNQGSAAGAASRRGVSLREARSAGAAFQHETAPRAETCCPCLPTLPFTQGTGGSPQERSGSAAFHRSTPP